MSLEIIPIGGFSEIGRNCVAVKHDDEIVILDMGLSMEQYIEVMEGLDNNRVGVSPKKLIQAGAVPDVTILGDLRRYVVGICATHAHLDHIGAIPFLSNRFDADVHATPFTAEMIESISNKDGLSLRNKVIRHPINGKFRLTKKIEIEFIHITHSVPDTVGIAVHTKDGTVLYMNDFKLDNSPTLGPKSNVKRLHELKGVKALIIDSLYADKHEKALSERIAEQMLFDAILSMDTRGKAIVITTFSSHIARLRTIAKLGERLHRKVVFLGRSIDKYASAADRANIHSFKGTAKIIAYREKIDRFLEKLDNPADYVIVTTGHQGEPKAVLSRVINENKLRLRPDDIVVFSSKTIPVDICIRNRERIEGVLRQKRVRILTDLHVSGHGAREDLRDALQILRPQHVIPTHGGHKQLDAFRELAIKELGYAPDKVHLLYNGQRLRLT